MPHSSLLPNTSRISFFKGESSAFETTFSISKKLAFTIGSIFFLISLGGGSLFFRKVYALEGETLTELLSYFYPASFTVLQNMLIFQYSAYYRNQFNTKISFFSTAISTTVNLFFDASLVYGFCGMPQLGTAGAAWGSVIGLFAGLLVYQIPYYVNKQKTRVAITCKEKRQIVQKLIKIYLTLFGQEFLENSLFVFIISGVVARMGTHHMAVHNLLITIGSVMELPIYAYAMATQTYALQSRAAGHVKQVKKYLSIGYKFTVIIIIGISLFCYIGQKHIFNWIVSDDSVILSAENLILWLFVMALTKVGYQIYMVFLQGIGKERDILQSTIAAMIIASISIVVSGKVFSLSGVYFVISSKYLILSMVYFRQSKSME